MTIPNARPVEVTLDRTRGMRMDLNALAKAEELTGRNFMQQGAWEGMGFREVRALVYACLYHEDPSLTLEQVGEMLHPGNLPEVVQALQEVFRGAMPEGEGKALRTRRPRPGPSPSSISG